MSNQVFNKPRNKFWVLIMFLICLTFLSCRTVISDEDCATYDYSDCNASEPSVGLLKADLTINNDNPYVLISVYRGRLEADDLLYTDTVREVEYSVYLELDYYYTVTAEYKSGEKTIIAVGGDEVRKTSEVICDSTCWSVREGNVDVRLKY
jgi:hypothetical protein